MMKYILSFLICFNLIAATIAEKEAMEARFDALPDLRLAMIEAGLNQPNSALFKKEVIENNDVVKMSALEAVSPNIVTALQKVAIEAGIDERFRCVNKVKKKMFYLNYGKGLTKVQVKKFVKDMKDIIDLIDAASLESAREDILAVVPDGTIITETDKTEIVAAIDSCK